MRLRVSSIAACLSIGALVAGCASKGISPGGSVLPDAARPHVAASTPANPIYVTTLADSGNGSLRSAIDAANQQPYSRPATIVFNVHGTIVLKSILSPLTRKMVIDGTTAPTYAHKAPVVSIDFKHHGGLEFAGGSDGSSLLALTVTNAFGSGILIGPGSITLEANVVEFSSGDGITILSASKHDTIGINSSGDSGAISNVVTGNGRNGIVLYGASYDTIADNAIYGNRYNGVWITLGAHDNLIGGTAYIDNKTGAANNPTGTKGTVTPVFVIPPDGNLISGNRDNGVVIERGATHNTLSGNFIGTTKDGDRAMGNGGDGVVILRANDNTLSGCKFVDNPFVYYNVVSGNAKNGLHISDSSGTVVQANFFGIGADNTHLVPNGGDGILVDGDSSGTIVGGVIPLGNVSAGNKQNGIEVKDTASTFTTFNTFGGLLAFKGAAPNGNDGLLITSTGGSQTVRTNVFSGNRHNGIEIGGDASGVNVNPDESGLNTKGDGALPNGGNGLLIEGTAHDNVIGGYLQSVIPQNGFSGNGGYGIAIADQAHDNAIFNSYVGTDILGTAAVPNKRGGIAVAGSAQHNVIGGTGANSKQPKRNLISGNTGNGVTLSKGTSFTSLIGNWIGLDRNAKKAIPNTGKPFVVAPGSTNNTIKGNVTTPQ